jgi:hypothetical protein
VFHYGMTIALTGRSIRTALQLVLEDARPATPYRHIRHLTATATAPASIENVFSIRLMPDRRVWPPASCGDARRTPLIACRLRSSRGRHDRQRRMRS